MELKLNCVNIDNFERFISISNVDTSKFDDKFSAREINLYCFFHNYFCLVLALYNIQMVFSLFSFDIIFRSKMRVNCSTCLELLTPSDNLVCTPCGHVFHVHCVMQWFESKKNCPQCRHSANEKNIRYNIWTRFLKCET